MHHFMRHGLPAAIALLAPLAVAAAEVGKPGEVEELRAQVAALQATLESVSRRLNAMEAGAAPQRRDSEGPIFTTNDQAATSDLLNRSQEAQKIVNALQKTSKEVFARTDPAVSEGLKRLHADRTAGKAMNVEAWKDARAAHVTALEISALVRDARGDANDVIGTALDLSKCAVGQRCPEPKTGNLADANKLMDGLMERNKRVPVLSKSALRAAYRFDERLKNVDGEDLDEGIEFLAFLDSNKDAQSLFGGDAVRFSAGVKGTQANLRLFALHRLNAWFTKDHVLNISTTANDNGPTRFYSNSDGIASSTKLTYSYALTRAKNKGDSFLGRMTQWSLNLTAGHDKFDYTEGKDGAARSTTRTSGSFGTNLLVYGSEKNDVHTVAFNVDYAHKLPDPAYSVPTAQHGWRLGYEYRRIAQTYGFAPGLSYQHRDRMLEVALPFYLFRDQSDDKTPFTGGVSLNHKRTVGHVDKPVRDTSVSVFVGAALSLLD